MAVRKVESDLIRSIPLFARVADEHLATGIAERSLVRLLDQLRSSPSAGREKVLLAAPEGERHVVGLRMIADVLDGAGFEVLYLGQDVPCGALRAAIGTPLPPANRADCDRFLAAARAALGEAEFDYHRAAGRGLALPDAIAAALRR